MGNFIRNCDILSTFDVGAAGGNREDLLDLIVNIAPDETQFFSSFRKTCLLYTSPSPRDATLSRMPSSA